MEQEWRNNCIIISKIIKVLKIKQSYIKYNSEIKMVTQLRNQDSVHTIYSIIVTGVLLGLMTAKLMKRMTMRLAITTSKY